MPLINGSLGLVKCNENFIFSLCTFAEIGWEIIRFGEAPLPQCNKFWWNPLIPMKVATCDYFITHYKLLFHNYLQIFTCLNWKGQLSENAF